MVRGVALLVFLAVLGAACSGDSGGGTAATPTLSATATVESAKDGDSLTCQVDLPTATLRYEHEVQDETPVAFNWNTPDCPFSAHPADTLPLPAEPLLVPQAARPELTFSDTPSSVQAYVWRPDYDQAEDDATGGIQVPLDDLRTSTRVDLAIEPLAMQALALDDLAPGDYAVEVFVDWADGSTAYAFRVQIKP